MAEEKKAPDNPLEPVLVLVGVFLLMAALIWVRGDWKNFVATSKTQGFFTPPPFMVPTTNNTGPANTTNPNQ